MLRPSLAYPSPLGSVLTHGGSCMATEDGSSRLSCTYDLHAVRAHHLLRARGGQSGKQPWEFRLPPSPFGRLQAAKARDILAVSRISSIEPESRAQTSDERGTTPTSPPAGCGCEAVQMTNCREALGMNDMRRQKAKVRQGRFGKEGLVVHSSRYVKHLLRSRHKRVATVGIHIRAS